MKPSTKKAIKLVLYALFLLLLFLLQTLPYPLIRIGTLRAEYLIPFCVALVLFDNPKTGAGFGLMAGLMLDMDSRLLFGLSALFLVLVLYLAGEWIHGRWVAGLRNAMWLSLFMIVLYHLFVYTFTLLFRADGNLLTGLLNYALPTAIISIPACFVINWIISKLARRFVPVEINLER